MIRALVFDFDGLILDTEGPDLQSWQEVYTALGCTLSFERWAAGIGTLDTFDPYADLEEQLGRPLDRAAIREWRRQRFTELIASQDALPGVREYIADARRLGLKLGIASSSPRSWVAGHLARLGLLEPFDCLCCAEDVPRVKPDPALYQAALTTLQITSGEAIALEDSPNGVLAARRAGIFCVAVPNVVTARLPLDHADLLVSSLADLPLEQLLERVA